MRRRKRRCTHSGARWRSNSRPWEFGQFRPSRHCGHPAQSLATRSCGREYRRRGCQRSPGSSSVGSGGRVSNCVPRIRRRLVCHRNRTHRRRWPCSGRTRLRPLGEGRSQGSPPAGLDNLPPNCSSPSHGEKRFSKLRMRVAERFVVTGAGERVDRLEPAVEVGLDRDTHAGLPTRPPSLLDLCGGAVEGKP